MARFHPAVTAYIEVPALLRCDHADVLALRFRTFARAAGDAELDLVRRAQTLVAVFYIDCETDRIAHAVAAPGRADTRLHRTHRLTVCVTGFKAGRNQLFPDQ